ncbi:imm11 family protein [Litchfieldia salsa]|uniref:Immunity MXAN-0049 protein domain-containing protein n=1 Tax=Litchfieldia salsa TaxID=930152 RepID=A0A1H0PXZ1_9BACI|nr:DUF1629 domain-containing protein [Litchfieldia salsa]SDP09358.1 hypothetical protein SAMN05216565_101494 [Litchfieldia salsa]
MKIWLLKKLYGNYETLKFENDNDSNVFHEGFRGVSMGDLKRIDVSTYNKGRKSDFPAGLLSPPVMSEKAVEVLRSLLEEKVEFVPMHKDNEKYYAINVVNTLDCIDPELSEARTFHGITIEYPKIVFKSEVVVSQDIFKYLFHDSKKVQVVDVFVSDAFRNRVIDSGLEGFDFIEVWNSESTIN